MRKTIVKNAAMTRSQFIIQPRVNFRSMKTAVLEKGSMASNVYKQLKDFFFHNQITAKSFVIFFWFLTKSLFMMLEGQNFFGGTISDARGKLQV